MQNELVTCHDCEEEYGEMKIAQVPLQSILKEGFLLTQCEREHIKILLSTSQKYEDHIYFSTSSLVNGNYRDAVTTAASAYDGFIEFALRVMLAFKEFEIKALEEALRKNKLSERRLGAFYFLFLTIIGHAPIAIANKKIELRNKVVHSTYIPSAEEAKDYAFSIYVTLLENLSALNKIIGLEKTIASQTPFEMQDGLIKKYNGCTIQYVELYRFTNLREFEDFDANENFNKMFHDIKSLNDLRINKHLA